MINVGNVSFIKRDAAWPVPEADERVCKLVFGLCSPGALEGQPHWPFCMMERREILWPQLGERIEIGGLAIRQSNNDYCPITLVIESIRPINWADIAAIVLDEEERFARRVPKLIRLFDKLAERLEAEGETVIPGEDAFFLHDTHGLWIDQLRDMARERGLTIDEEGFEEAMEEQRKRSRPERVGLDLWPDMIKGE